MRRLASLIPMAAIVFAVPLALAPTAAADTSCSSLANSDSNLYAASAADLAACGFTSYPLASVTPLAGGGAEYTYGTPGSQFSTSEIVPPAGFDPATATTAQQTEYGVPPEPSVSDPAGQAQWLHMVSNWQSISPANRIIGLNNVTNQVIPNPNSIWSGYADEEGYNYFHYAWGIYTQPSAGHSHCSTYEESTWVGIGGTQGVSALGQAGTYIGNVLNVPQGQYWYETNVGTTYMPDGYVVPAGEVLEDFVSYNTSGDYYTYTFANETTGLHGVFQFGSSTYFGSTTEFIVERPTVNGSPTNLANFGTLSWDYVASAVQENPISDYPYQNLTMGTSSDTMATASALSDGGYQFTNGQHSCD
jgi:hypothetical protein